MNKVLLVQFNNQYGNQAYVPYSIGLLKAYACQDEFVRANFEFLPFICLRGDVDKMVASAGHIDVLGISCYVWNWTISVELAKAVRKKYPKCLIILGGPQIPNEADEAFFEENAFADIICQGEGEETFCDILNKMDDIRTLRNIPGTAYRCEGQINFNRPRPLLENLNRIPSPYLSGIFDYLLSDDRLKWMAIWETNRGCPFSCAFCDWGSLGSRKMRLFDETRLVEEIKFFSDNRISLIFGADSNFGILKRDTGLAEKLVDSKKRTGYPEDFRVCFTKNSTNRVFDLARKLASAGMNKGVSISVQSLNPEVLENVNRKNIKLSFFKELQEKYFQEGLVTYTELILPLPGETYESFTDGLESILNNSQHSGIVMYNCTVVPNAEMGQVSYQEAYGLDIVSIPILQAHSSKKSDRFVEKESIVVGTKTMPRNEWRRAFKFSWIIQSTHILGLLQAISIVLKYHHGIGFKEFYEGFLENGGKTIRMELETLDGVLDDVLAGLGFDQLLEDFEPVVWPPEEATFLRILTHFDQFYREVFEYILTKFPQCNEGFVRDLVRYQKELVQNYWDGEDRRVTLKYDFDGFLKGCKRGEKLPLKEASVTYLFSADKYYNGDARLFSREVVWFGRKGGKFLKRVRRLSDIVQLGVN